MISKPGIQGSLVYAASRQINALIETAGSATLQWDLLPDMPEQTILEKLSVARGKESRSNFLRKRLGITGVKAALLHEFAKDAMESPQLLAAAIKALPMIVSRARPLDEAISTSGGLSFSELDAGLMLKKFPGVFCAGEMLDWDAPTGGYLLTACLSSGHRAGQAAVSYLHGQATID
jgi:predicted flavoprotein YhiN